MRQWMTVRGSILVLFYFKGTSFYLVEMVIRCLLFYFG